MNDKPLNYVVVLKWADGSPATVIKGLSEEAADLCVANARKLGAAVFAIPLWNEVAS